MGTTIKQYQDYCKLSTGSTDIQYISELSNIIGLDTTDLTQEEIIKKITDWKNNLIISKQDIKYVRLNKKWYKVDKELVNLKFSQWINFDNIMLNMNKENIYEDLHFILAIFLRPCRIYKFFPKKFNGNDFLNISKIVQEKMDIKEALNLFNFFLSYIINSTNNTNIKYLERLETMTWENQKESQNLIKNTDGTYTY